MQGTHEASEADLRASEERDDRNVRDDDLELELEDRERVARRPSALPAREEEEEELAEADILEQWDVDDFDDDDED